MRGLSDYLSGITADVLSMPSNGVTTLLKEKKLILCMHRIYVAQELLQWAAQSSIQHNTDYQMDPIWIEEWCATLEPPQGWKRPRAYQHGAPSNVRRAIQRTSEAIQRNKDIVSATTGRLFGKARAKSLLMYGVAKD